MQIDVADNAAASRYELQVDGRLAGWIDYRVHSGQIAMVHAEVDERLSGQGLGGKMARAALDDVRTRGLQVAPLCPFILEYVRRHQDRYLDLVVPSMRHRVTAGFPHTPSASAPDRE